MTINQRAVVDDVLVDVVCTGRFYDFLEKRDGRWGIVRRQPIYEKDRMDPVDPCRAADARRRRLASFPEGYRHLAYLQSTIGFTVKGNLPGLRGPAVETLYAEGAAWLAGLGDARHAALSRMHTRTLGPVQRVGDRLRLHEPVARLRHAARAGGRRDACCSRRSTSATRTSTRRRSTASAPTRRCSASVLKHRWHEVVLATKGGMFRNAQGQREIDGRPEVIVQNCDESLARLGIETIDLYYLHRWDKKVPVEDSVGALAGLVKAGKVKTIGLTEVSAATIRAAHAVHPITRRADRVLAVDAQSRSGRARHLPRAGHHLRRLQPARARIPDRHAARHRRPAAEGHPARHAALSAGALAEEPGAARRARRRSPTQHDCTMGQLALAWVLAHGDHIVPIPGTTRLDHLEENAGAVDVHLARKRWRRWTS